MAQTGSENREDVRPLQFGNYRIPQSKGLAGLSTAATVLLIAGAVFCVFLVMLHQWVAAAAVVLLLAYFILAGRWLKGLDSGRALPSPKALRWFNELPLLLLVAVVYLVLAKPF